jgi:collagenase-like PrtC family protease
MPPRPIPTCGCICRCRPPPPIPDAINFYAETFGIRRVVLPRVLTVDEITAINREIDVETEVFVFGGLVRHGRGALFAVLLCHRLSPNMNGVCSPASHVAYAEVAGTPRRGWAAF